MFQNFEDRSDRTQSAGRVARLRDELKSRGLDGFIVPRSDEHQGEYVAPSAERLAWLTGFAGSAGTAVVLAERAVIFVDGRYTLQVREQVDTGLFEPVAVMETSVAEWLKRETKGLTIGYDPWLLTRSQATKIEAALKAVGGSLVAVDTNPVDAIWDDRPAPPTGPVIIQEDDLAGRAPPEKIAEVAAAIAEKQADAAVISDPASVAWLFNIRGSDVPHTPLPLSFAVVPTSGRPEIFVDGRKLSNAVRDRIEGFGDVQDPRQACRAARRALGRRQAHPLRRAGLGGGARADRRGCRRDRGRRRRPGGAPEGAEERGGARRHAPRACPRRRRGDPLPASPWRGPSPAR